MILPSPKDPRLTTRRRGGSLSDEDHRRLAAWAAQCAEHVLPLFEEAVPGDPRPRKAIEAARAWARGDLALDEAKAAAYHANEAARGRPEAPKCAAYAAGQAAVVAHVPAHDLGAAAYAIRAARAVAGAVGDLGGDEAGRRECAWQRSILPPEVAGLVLEDQVRRNSLCWNVFTPAPGP